MAGSQSCGPYQDINWEGRGSIGGREKGGPDPCAAWELLRTDRDSSSGSSVLTLIHSSPALDFLTKVGRMRGRGTGSRQGRRPLSRCKPGFHTRSTEYLPHGKQCQPAPSISASGYSSRRFASPHQPSNALRSSPLYR